MSELFDLTAHVQDEPIQEFAEKLEKTVDATKALVTKFVQLGDKQSSVLRSESFSECQKAQNEVSFLGLFHVHC